MAHQESNQGPTDHEENSRGRSQWICSFIDRLSNTRAHDVRDEPVVVHCYTTPFDIESGPNLAELGGFCRKMGREAHQGEIGLVVGDEYFAIRDFTEE